MPELIGKDVGRYHIIEQYGMGGMAVVYRAYDTRLEREVALKIIRRGAFSPDVVERMLKRFEREAKSLARLTHPNIVPIIDYGEHEGSPYLVMPLIAGGTLKLLLENRLTSGMGPYGSSEAARLLSPIAHALDYAHRREILHRDVKPSNILLTDNHDPLLTDFGIAKILEEGEGSTLTGTGVGIGTPEYMAPEQWLGKSISASDQYSLGVVLYELVTGCKPYTADTPAAILLKQATAPLQRPRTLNPDMPDETEQVLFKALAKKPEDRYASMAEFAIAIEKLAQKSARPAPRPTSTPPPPDPDETYDGTPTPPAPPPPTVKTGAPLWVWGLGGLILLGMVGLGLRSVFSGKPDLTATPLPVATQTSRPSQENATPVKQVEKADPTEQPGAELLDVKSSDPETVCKADENGCAVVQPGKTIQIGMAGPMTGDYASFGVDISQGGQIAINDNPGIEEWKFELVVGDTQGSPELGAAVANKWAAVPNLVAVAGHIFSGETEAAMPTYEKAGIPMLSPSATNPALTTLGSTVFNRIAFTDTVQAADSAKFLFNNLRIKKLAVLYEDGSAYGQGLAEMVKSEFTRLGGEVVIIVAITPGETDYSAVLSSIAAKSPEAVYYGGYIGEAIVIANQMDQAGLQGVVLFGCDGIYGPDFIDKAGADAEGTYAASLVPLASNEEKKFAEEYKAEFGTPPGVLSPYTWSGYDAVAALMAKVTEVAFRGDDGNLYIPRAELVSAVRGMQGFQGITGEITCSTVGECNTYGPSIYVVKNGEWVNAR